ncbi:MAG: serine acetyltransferase [Myxococcales bacterium]
MLEEIASDFRCHGHSLRSGGFWALVVYRFGRWSMHRENPVWRRTCSLAYGQIKPIVTFFTGVDLECTTQIGADFHIVHAGAVSIHPEAVIGNRVGVMHGVTIGSNMGPEAPVIEDDVFIGCNASVLGGVTIGQGARVAANSLVISDVPPGAIAIGVPARSTADASRLRLNASDSAEARPSLRKIRGGATTEGADGE